MLDLGIDVWVAVKWLVIFAFVLYVFFALVIIRQVQLMTKTLEIGFETQIKLIAIAHFVGAIIALVMAIVVL